jgi:putative addiction module component (TIGR02574 family)
MTTPLEMLAAEALKLTPEDRVQLADRLLASIFPDKEGEDAWSQEVERRVREIESGHAKLTPAAEAIARASRRLGEG